MASGCSCWSPAAPQTSHVTLLAWSPGQVRKEGETFAMSVARFLPSSFPRGQGDVPRPPGPQLGCGHQDGGWEGLDGTE